MDLIARIKVELNDKEVNRIVRSWLSDMKGGRWIVKGDVFEEHATSHRFDAKVGKASDPKFAILKAVEDFEDALKKAGFEWR